MESSESQVLENKKPAVNTAGYGFHGGADGDRTHDLMNAIHALSQLSYSPT
jgi:hypothetical protein